MNIAGTSAIQDQYYRRLVERLPAAVCMCDAEGRITLFNDAAVMLWGRSPAIGKDLWCGSWRVFRPDGPPLPLESCPMAVSLREKRALVGEEIIIERPDGSRRHVLPHSEPIFDGSGGLVAAVNVLVDITDRREAERAQARLASIVASSSDAIISKTLDGVITSWNDGAQRMFGYTAEEAIGRPITMLIPPERRSEEAAILQRLRRGERIDHFETVRIAKDGRRLHISLSVSPLRDGTGRIVGAAKIARDITAQVIAAGALKESEQRLRLATQTGKVGVWDWDIEANHVRWSESLYAIHGVTPAQFSPTVEGFGALVHPEDRERVSGAIAAALHGNAPYELEFRAVRPDGEVAWLFTNAHVVRDGGRPLHMVGATLDITRLKRAEQAVRESEEQYRALAESMPFIVWQTDASGSTGYANRCFQEYSGLSPDQLRDRNAWLLVHPDDRPATQERFAESLRTGRPYRGVQRIRRADGAWRWFEVAAEPVRDGHGRITRWVGAAIDIDDRRKAERTLGAVRDDLALQVAGLTRLHELSTALTVSRDLPGALSAIVEAIADLHGSDRGLLSLFDPARGELYDGASLRFDEAALRTLARIEPGPGVGACGTCFHTGRRVIVEDTETDPCFADYREGARSLGFRAVHSTPILTRAGKVLGVLSVHFATPRRPSEREIQFADMCARLAADAIVAAGSEAELAAHREHLERMVAERTRELDESHTRLRLSERMALLGTLAAGLGHDMGNLLMPVRVRIESLERAPLGPEHAEDLRAIKRSADYLQRLSNGLRLLALDPERSRRGEATEIGAWWIDAEPVFRNGLARGITLAGQVPQQPCWAEIARPSLTQAVFNLIQNAGDALRGRGAGKVTVSVAADEAAVRISVADDGPGMTEEVRRRCMEPFFTTKARGISTGLGLVLVAGLVQDAGGSVSVDSAPGRGSTFVIELRRARLPSHDAQARGPAGRARVRLQDARLRSIVFSELSQLTFEVLPDSAPDSAPESDGQADLLVLDASAEPAALRLRAGGRAVILADSALNQPGVRVLGARPSAGAIREALREAAGHTGELSGRGAPG
jgi:PAS domain S-box-containing protein